MGRYSDYHPTPATRDYMTKIPGFMDQVGADIDELAEGKADANHSHGTGGEVVSIGAADARPAVTDGFIHSEPGASAEETALVILNADGTERARAIMSTGAQTITGSLSVPTPTAPEHAANKGYVDARIVKGFITGLYPVYRDGSSIDVAPGVVTIGGQIYELPTAVTLTPTLTASSWHYIYVSATPAATTLTASDFTVSTTAPTRADDGWYDGSGNRCIGFFYADSTPAIVAFTVGSNGWWFADGNGLLLVMAAPAPFDTVTAVSANAPVNPALCYFNVHPYVWSTAGVINGVRCVLLPGDSTLISIGSSVRPNSIGFVTDTSDPYHYIYGMQAVTTNSAGQFKYAAYATPYSGGYTCSVTIHLAGLSIPAGLGRV